MLKKKIMLILLAVGLSTCLFFSFGFQIGVSGTVNRDGGTADVSLSDPLRVAADEANAAFTAAQLALKEAEASVTEAGLEAATAQVNLGAAGTEEAIAAAKLALEDAEKAQTEAGLALIAAQKALEAAQIVADEANAAYSGIKFKNEKELEALQLALDEAKAALEAAIEAQRGEEIIAELQQIVDAASSVLEESSQDISGSMYSHIITNSNKGGSFNIEGNWSGFDGDLLQYTFNSEEGSELVWLRIGNIKIQVTDGINLYDYDFNKKNLTIHAQFKKDKDYIAVEDDSVPEPGSDQNKGQEKKENKPTKENKGKNKKK